VAATGSFQIENLNMDFFALRGAISPLVGQEFIFPVVASRELDAFVYVMSLFDSSLKIFFWLKLKVHFGGSASIIQARTKPIGMRDVTHFAW
jgi:hypothetical protein